MELLTGGSLGERVRAGDPLDADELLEVAIQMTDALSAAHQAGVLHRDVKPDNILLNRQGEYVLSDFGIATLDDGTQSTTGSYSGTYAFSAPELLRGSRASESSDLYSLGATLHALASGRAPFTSKADATPAATLLRILEDPVPDLPTGVPSTLASLICSLMAKDPEERPRSAADLRAALDTTRARRSATSTTGVSSDGPTADVVGETMTGGGAETWDEPSSKSAGPALEADPDAPTVTRAPAPTLARSPAEAVKVPETGPDRDAGGPPSSGSAPPRASDPSPSEAPRRKRILLITSLVIVAVLAGLGFVVSGRDSATEAAAAKPIVERPTRRAPPAPRRTNRHLPLCHPPSRRRSIWARLLSEPTGPPKPPIRSTRSCGWFARPPMRGRRSGSSIHRVRMLPTRSSYLSMAGQFLGSQ
jgi:serine/threonine protein kinase